VALNERAERIADALDRVAADLDELMFDGLREAVAERGARPVDDKRLLQARRAVDKAIHLLRGQSGDD
jgi:hypothetical protein